jgi:hypothetical protein
MSIELQADAIKEIERLINQARVVFEEPYKPYLLKKPDGSFDRIEPKIPNCPLDLKVLDTFTLTALARDAIGPKRILLSPDKVVLIHEPNDKTRTSHTLILRLHPAFQILLGWADTKKYDQKALVRLLRTKFAGYVDKDVASRFEKIKVSTQGEVERTVNMGKDAIAKKLEQKAMFGDLSPVDMFTVKLPVYDLPQFLEPEYHAKVTVLVEINPDPLEIELTTVFNDLQLAREAALNLVEEALNDTEVPIYRATL